jgi:inorganic pyrophosphatase
VRYGEVSPNLRHEIEHFFVSYNAAKGKQFKVLGSHGPERARELLKKSMTSTEKEKK